LQMGDRPIQFFKSVQFDQFVDAFEMPVMNGQVQVGLIVQFSEFVYVTSQIKCSIGQGGDIVGKYRFAQRIDRNNTEGRIEMVAEKENEVHEEQRSDD
jgi:hypothetical protein